MNYPAYKKKIESYLSGGLLEKERTLLNEHFQECEKCRLLLEEVKEHSAYGLVGQKDSVSLDGVTVPGYNILSLLGKGGMGSVYRAVQTSMNREVALKILAENLSTNNKFIQRFEREAHASGRLSHPSLIKVYDFGSSGDTYYFAMEYIEGQELHKVIKKDGRVDIRTAIEIALQVAEGLEYAFETETIIHRDIKPENIMLTGKGAKIADLGLAKKLDDDADGLTMVGERLGTPYYMPPEQIKATKDADHRADIYSLGATLFHMVTGRRPFTGKTPAEVMQNVMYSEASFTHEEIEFIPDAVRELILKMMQKKPKDRLQKWKIVVRKLNTILNKELKNL